jgi:hypothetical protein
MTTPFWTPAAVTSSMTAPVRPDGFDTAYAVGALRRKNLVDEIALFEIGLSHVSRPSRSRQGRIILGTSINFVGKSSYDAAIMPDARRPRGTCAQPTPQDYLLLL